MDLGRVFSVSSIDTCFVPTWLDRRANVGVAVRGSSATVHEDMGRGGKGAKGGRGGKGGAALVQWPQSW